MMVSIPSPLLSYTAQAARVEASGDTVGEVLADLDRRFPGIRFRIVDETARLRAHIKLFVNDRLADGLEQRLEPLDRVHIVAALSGG